MAYGMGVFSMDIFGIVTEIDNGVAAVMLTAATKILNEWRPAGAYVAAKVGAEVKVDDKVIIEGDTAYLYEYVLAVKK